MSRSIFINNTSTVDDATSEYNNAAEVPAEQIAIIDIESGRNVDLTASGTAPDRMQIVQGVDDEEDGLIISQEIRKSDITGVTVEEHVSPTHQVTEVSDISSPSKGDVYSIKFVEISQGFERYPRRNYEYVAKSDDTTSDVVDALVDLINDDKRSFIKASNESDTLELTARDSSNEFIKQFEGGLSFGTHLGNSLEDASIEVTETPSAGSGNYAQIRDLEELTAGNRGFYNRTHLPQTPTYFADKDTDYELVTIRHKNNAQIGLNTPFKESEITLAFPDGSDAAEDIKDFLTGEVEEAE